MNKDKDIKNYKIKLKDKDIDSREFLNLLIEKTFSENQKQSDNKKLSKLAIETLLEIRNDPTTKALFFLNPDLLYYLAGLVYLGMNINKIFTLHSLSIYEDYDKCSIDSSSNDSS